MAGIFTSFRTSAMPKRLLRYAMAKFDIFEDDALDLENLDLGFGFKNTFEFKDVGLKVDVRAICPFVLFFCIHTIGSTVPCTDNLKRLETHKAASLTRRVPYQTGQGLPPSDHRAFGSLLQFHRSYGHRRAYLPRNLFQRSSTKG